LGSIATSEGADVRHEISARYFTCQTKLHRIAAADLLGRNRRLGQFFNAPCDSYDALAANSDGLIKELEQQGRY
jgi:hypothetical protein